MGNNELQNKIELYKLLLDQIQKYNTILWQFPTILSIANIIALFSIRDLNTIDANAITVFAIADLGLAYAFTKMVITQSKIIDTAKEAEEELRNIRGYENFVPYLEDHHSPSARWVLVWILWILWIIVLDRSKIINLDPLASIFN